MSNTKCAILCGEVQRKPKRKPAARPVFKRFSEEMEGTVFYVSRSGRDYATPFIPRDLNRMAPPWYHNGITLLRKMHDQYNEIDHKIDQNKNRGQQGRNKNEFCPHVVIVECFL